MFYIKIADLTVAIDNKYEYVRMLCRDYIIPPVESPDTVVKVSDEEIKEEIAIAEFPVSEAYAEGVCVYRHICKPLPERVQHTSEFRGRARKNFEKSLKKGLTSGKVCDRIRGSLPRGSLMGAAGLDL